MQLYADEFMHKPEVPVTVIVCLNSIY